MRSTCVTIWKLVVGNDRVSWVLQVPPYGYREKNSELTFVQRQGDLFEVVDLRAISLTVSSKHHINMRTCTSR